MKEFSLDTRVRVYAIDELGQSDQAWVAKAITAARHAYAPYSRFCVGAVVQLANGVVLTGSNQENVAYPSGLCAERVAIFQANHQYPDQPVVRLAIAATTDQGEQVAAISPCGACRQVMLETEQRYKQPIEIWLCGKDEVIIVESAAALLPLCFGMGSIPMKS